MREAELAAPVAAWLEARGLTVYAEVPSRGRAIDIVGARLEPTPPLIVTVELKTGFTEHLLWQAWLSTYAADEAYACAPTKPAARTIEEARRRGIGLLRCIGSRVEVLVEPTTPAHRHWARTEILERLITHPKGSDGGKPCMAGIGPAHNVRALVKAYILANPGHGWPQIFANVPNHYRNAKSLAGVMSRRYRVSLGNPHGSVS